MNSDYTISIKYIDQHETSKFPLPDNIGLGKVINLAMTAFKVNQNVQTVAILNEDGMVLAYYDGKEWR